MKEQSKNFKKIVQENIKSLIIILPIVFVIRTYGYGLYQVPSESMETTMLVGEKFISDKLTPYFWPIKHNEIIAFNDPRYPYSSNRLIEWFQMYVYGPLNITKRVIACPGDEIKGKIENDKPVIYLRKKGELEFKKLEESYLNTHPIIATCPSSSNQGRTFEYRTIDLNKKLDQQAFYNFTENELQVGIQKAISQNTPPILQPQTPTTVDNFHIALDDDHYWVMGDNRLGSGDSRFWGPLHKKFIHGRIRFRIFSIDSSNSWQLLDLVRHPIDFWKKIRWSRCLQVIS
jgi:signal peptidase I